MCSPHSFTPLPDVPLQIKVSLTQYLFLQKSRIYQHATRVLTADVVECKLSELLVGEVEAVGHAKAHRLPVGIGDRHESAETVGTCGHALIRQEYRPVHETDTTYDDQTVLGVAGRRRLRSRGVSE